MIRLVLLYIISLKVAVSKNASTTLSEDLQYYYDVSTFQFEVLKCVKFSPLNLVGV